METLRDKYNRDTQFRALVEMMVAYIHQAEFTPSDMREAFVKDIVNAYNNLVLTEICEAS